MAVRATMAELISRMRTLIGDPAGASQIFDDQTIQDYLDRHRTSVRYVQLRAAETILVGGTVEYRDYYADYGNWEADEELYDGTYKELTPATADRLTGHWAFTTNQQPPVLIVGNYYDVYGAAADLLEAWAAQLKLAYAFTTDGQTFNRQQQLSMLLEMARGYRRQQRPMSVGMVRSDADC